MAASRSFPHRKSLVRFRRPTLAHRVPIDAIGVTSKNERTLFSFYVRGLQEVFRATANSASTEAPTGARCRESARPGAAALFLVASTVHSFAHAGLALAAGRCAAVLAGASFGLASASSTPGLRSALHFGSLGLVAAVVKASGGVVAAHEQAKIAARVGGQLRLDVLDDWFASYRLRRPRHGDHGQRTAPPQSAYGRPPATSSRTSARGVSALTARISDIETGLSQGLLGGGRTIAQLAPLAAALVWISPRLALAALTVLVPFSILLSFTRGAWRRAYSKAARDGEELLEAADEAVRHADLWVSYSAESKARAVVAHLGDTLGGGAARIQASAAAMSGANEVLAAVALVCALGAAACGWLGDVGDSTRLLAFTVCFFLAYRPIRDLTEARLAWSRASLSFYDLSALGDPDGAREACRAAVEDAHVLRELSVESLVLARGTSAAISFVLPPGEVVAVVGGTGEGKTTLVRTLLGLEPAVSGEVRYGTTVITDARPGLTDRPFAWVPQDTALLTDTLEANIGLASTAIDAGAVLRKLGGESLELLSTTGARLGPGGVVVSGGERQWIALARAFATSQPILILDEPTSGLDPSSQARVLDAIAGLRGERSIVLVTHRSEPLALADIIVHFDGLNIHVEDGPRRRGVSETATDSELLAPE